MKQRTRALMLLLLLAAVAGTSQAQERAVYDRTGYVADIPPGAHMSQGIATIISDTVILVEHFTYDGTAPGTFFVLGATNDDTAFQNGLTVGSVLTRAYSDETVVLELDPGESLDGYTALSVYCVQAQVNFSSASFVAPLGFPYARRGWVADFPPGDHMTDGTVTIVDDRLLFVEHFTYDGGAPAVYFRLGADDSYDSFLYGLQLDPLLDRAYSDEWLVLALPDGENMDPYGAVSVWCAAVSANFTSAPFLEPPEVPALSWLGLGGLITLLSLALRRRRRG